MIKRSAFERRSADLLRAIVAFTALYVAACSDSPLDPVAGDVAMRSAVVTGASFTDEFSFFDEARWIRSAHTLGRGPLLPANVEQYSGAVGLVTRSSDYSGAEIMSRDLYTTGTFTINARCAVPGGAICAFFMYEIGVGNRADEIDIELIPSTGRIWFTTWKNGKRTFHAEKQLPFNAAADFHSYSFERTGSDLRFLVDGVLMQTFRGKRLPQAAMPIFANAWWPTWLVPASGTGAWEINSISAR